MESEIEILKKYNQNHILKMIETMSTEEKEKIKKDIQNVDFEKVFKLYKDSKEAKKFDSKNILPLHANVREKMSPEKIDKIINLGEECIRSGKYAVATVAGGQGTRLRMQSDQRENTKLK